MMQGQGNGGYQVRRLLEGRSSLSNLDRQIASFDEFRHNVAESKVGAAHVMDRHDVGMVQPGEDLGFDQKRLGILRVSDSLRIWHLDGDRAVEVIVVSQINSPESALTEPTDDPIAPNSRWLFVQGAFKLSNGEFGPPDPDRLFFSSQDALASAGRSGAFRFRRAFRLIHHSIPGHHRSLTRQRIGAIVSYRPGTMK